MNGVKPFQCDKCVHCEKYYHEFPCSECAVIKNGEDNMFHPRGHFAIADSGDRREFTTGAVRDMAEGKGRCDLMPLDIIADFGRGDDRVVLGIHDFVRTGDTNWLSLAIDEFLQYRSKWANRYDMWLDVAVHFEEGAKKYGENNWQKGLPARSYVDSALRHYWKFMRGDVDERHDSAFVWNLVCCMWTEAHKPEVAGVPWEVSENE